MTVNPNAPDDDTGTEPKSPEIDPDAIRDDDPVDPDDVTSSNPPTDAPAGLAPERSGGREPDETTSGA